MKKLVVLCVLLYSCSENDDLEQISYSQFRQEVLANQIVEITYKSDQMTIIGDRFDGSKFETTQPTYKKDEVLERVLKENNVRQTYEPVEQPSISSQLVIGAMPLFVIILFIPLSFAIWAAYLASNRNQSKALWFFLTLFLPFAIVVIAFKDKVEKN
tara:strand:+ start:103 stop:573 length:471 start_codon:yes stop_codon:yes gene_type:complete